MGERRPKKRLFRRLVVLLLINACFLAVIAAAAVVWVWTSFASSLPDLEPWHLEAPASEFTADDESPGYTLADLLGQEARVFEELDALVAGWSSSAEGVYSRFRRGSVCDPEIASDRNWNRSLLLEAEAPAGGALLIHGLSDSPYSLRAIGETLHGRGWTVLWLRVPGHGTCPAALAKISRDDWAAAVRVAARGLAATLPEGAPLLLGGYSNGGALAAAYAAEALDDPDLPDVDRLALFSPMIGITGMARTTQLYPLVARISGLERVGWSRVDRAIDPFKYSSWPMNASVQAWRMTLEVEARLRALDNAGRMAEFPPVIAFQSAVDSTVQVPRLIRRLFDRLEPGPGAAAESRLVLYDVNREAGIADLVSTRFETQLAPLLTGADRPYALALVTNESPDSELAVERRFVAGEVSETPIGLSWPSDVFSLSHGAIPIPFDDPILGPAAPEEERRLSLADLSLRGETGVLQISESLMVRLRANPFYPHMESALLEWLGAGAPPETPGD